MFFLGGTFLASPETLQNTITDIKDVNSIVVQNGIYDNLYVTRDVESDYTTTTREGTWDYDTVLNASFNGDLQCGNVYFVLNNTSLIRIRRRIYDEFDWLSLVDIPTTTKESLTFEFYDRIARAKEKYEYALVPVTNGIEGDYNVNSVDTDFKGIFLVEPDVVYHTETNIDPIETQRNSSGISVETRGRKYPKVFHNSESNYETGSLTASFLEYNLKNKTYNYYTDWKYRKKFKDWTMNGNTKMLKHEDGRMWMISVIDAIPENERNHKNNITNTINFVESGDAEDKKYLYYNGFTNVAP